MTQSATHSVPRGTRAGAPALPGEQAWGQDSRRYYARDYERSIVRWDGIPQPCDSKIADGGSSRDKSPKAQVEL